MYLSLYQRIYKCNTACVNGAACIWYEKCIVCLLLIWKVAFFQMLTKEKMSRIQTKGFKMFWIREHPEPKS